MASILFFSNIGVLNANNETQTQLSALLSIVSNISDTVHSLQQERGASSGFVSSDDEQFKLKLEIVSKNSDLKIKKLLTYINENEALLSKYFTYKEYVNLNNKFNELYLLRDMVKNKKFDFAKVYSKYTQIIASLLLNISDISDKPKNKELRDKLYAYSTLLMYKESIGQKRAALSALFSQKIFSKEIYEYFLTSDTQEKIYLKTFLHSVGKSTQALYANTLDNEVVTTVQNYEKLALDKLSGKDVNVNSVAWFESVTKKINLVQRVEYKNFEEISKLGNALDNSFFNSLTSEEKSWIRLHKTINVASETDYAPWDFTIDSKPAGYSIDYIKLLAKKTGLKLNFVTDTWDNLVDKTQSGEIDLIHTMYKNKIHSNFIFIAPYKKVIIGLYANKNNGNIFSVNDLSKKTVSAPKGDSTFQGLSQTISGINFKFTDGYIESLKDVAFSKSDATIMDMAVANYLIKQNTIPNIKIIGEANIDSKIIKNDYYLVVNKKLPILASILKKSMNSVTTEEEKQISNKWIPSLLNTGNYNKVGLSSALPELNKEEKEWLLKNQPLTYVYDPDWAPLEWKNGINEHVGIIADVLKVVKKKSGINFVVAHPRSWNDALLKVKNGSADMVSAMAKSKDREVYANFSKNSIFTIPYVFVSREKSDFSKGFDSIGNKKISFVDGYAIEDIIIKNRADLKYGIVESVSDGFEKLSNNKIDILLLNRATAQYMISKNKYKNLKISYSTEYTLDIKIAIRKGYPKEALSIINKTLNTINRDEINTIYEKWFSEVVEKNDKELDIAFHFDRPPYMYGKTSSKGIEADLVKEIFQQENYDVNIHQMAKQNMEKILTTNQIFDGVASVSDNGAGDFYSDKYTLYENFVITRKSDNIKIDSIEELSNYNFVSWENAYNDLGKTFYKYFNPTDGMYKSAYHDRESQKEQHELFFDKKFDALVVDKKIFEWYKNHLNKTDEYTFHPIFPLATDNIVRFKDENIRDIFNKGLKKIKISGRFDEIVNFYLNQDILPLLNYSDLMADISGRFIFRAQPTELKKILNKFLLHPDIVHINVLDKATDSTFVSLYAKNTKITDSEKKELPHHLPSIKKDIYFINKGNPLHVGKIEIFYKKDFKNSRGELVPQLTDFIEIDKNDLKKVRRSYKKFGFNYASIELTKEEQVWLKSHSIVKFSGDPSWLPFEAFNKDGKYIGIVSEYLNKLEGLTGVTFERVHVATWNKALELSKNKQIDVLSETTELSREGLVFTKPYLTNNIVIVMDKEHPYVEGLGAIKNKKIALIKDYGYIQQIEDKYPYIDFIKVDNIQEGLTAVSTGKVDALACTFALGSYTTTKMGISNIKIVGKTQFQTSLGFGVREDYAPLISILNKGIERISEEEHNEILNHWIKQDYVEKVDYALLYKVGGGAFFLIIMFVFWNRKMAQEINKRKEIEVKLQDSAARMSTLFDASPDSISILDANGNYVDCNEATLKIFGLSSKEEFLQLKPSDLSPKLQYNNQLSSEVARKEIAIAFEKGINRFEWVHKRIDSEEELDTEVVLSLVSLDGNPYIYGIVRDITETKKTQKELKEIQDKQKITIENKVKELTLKQTTQLKTIERSNQLLSGRENKMVELKSEINEYALKLGIQEPYVIVDDTQIDLLVQSQDITKEIDITTLLDIPKLQLLLEDFYRFMNIPLAIIDLKGNILVQSKWSRACTDFHRANSESCKRCIESDTDISHSLEEGKNFSVYKCKNGLIDCASPLIVDGKHFANFFIGQFLIEEPDMEFFTNQIKLFGYDEDDYISAIKDAVVISEDRLPHILGFLKEVTEMIATLSTEKLNFKRQEVNMSKANIASMNLAEDAQKATKEIETYKNHLEDLVTERTVELSNQKEFVQILLDSQEQLIVTTSGQTITSANQTFTTFYNVENIEEFKVDYGAACICETFNTNAPEGYLQINMGEETWIDYVIARSDSTYTHKVMISRHEVDYIFSVSAAILPGEDDLKSAVFTNITEMENAKQEVETIHKHTRESIEYASLIQSALIPDNKAFGNYFSDYFTLWHPKDIVGGDVYLFEGLRDKDECLLMVIDCTGHGVPGAFVTMLVKAVERQIVAKINYGDEEVSPAKILSIFNKNMKQLLKQESINSVSNAGFDGGIIYFNKKEKILKFAGAETPLFYIEDGELKTIKGSRHSIGYKKSDPNFEFKEHIIKVKEGMEFYCTTDGYLDQNGGEKGFPFGKKRFANLIAEWRLETMTDKQEILLNALADYQGSEDRNDDITVVGFKI